VDLNVEERADRIVLAAKLAGALHPVAGPRAMKALRDGIIDALREAHREGTKEGAKEVPAGKPEKVKA
jgi:hypothetical protein